MSEFRPDDALALLIGDANDLAVRSHSLSVKLANYVPTNLEGGSGQPAQSPLIWWWPMGTLAERQAGPGMPGDWFDAVPFGSLYQAGADKAIHPACDCNRPSFKDAGAEVYAPADGTVTFAGAVEGWQGWMIIVKHVMENGQPVWSQMAHLDQHFAVHVGQVLERGTLLGHIGEYLPVGPANDHLHYALRKKDLPASDWPGLNRDRVLADYYAPLAFMAAHWARG
jgi:murein DD-endopeptidase MepM/ murein hydrolase activator NlpD